MGLIRNYNLRSIFVRKTTATMTALGIGMVVAVFVMTLALAQGFRATLVSSGSPSNAIILRKGATSENVSIVPQSALPIIEALPQIARADGEPLASPETLLIISLPRTSDGQPANVSLRGVGPRAYRVHDGVTIVRGRIPTPGLREVVAGQLAANRFGGLDLDRMVKVAGAEWRLVGIFAAGDASFESELWGDVDLLNAAFERRNVYQSVTVKLTDPSTFEAFAAALAADPRLNLKPDREREYYAAQSVLMTTTIRVLGTFVTLILSVGAMFGAMNTMYAAVAYRTREIGTLRALGFSRLRIVSAFLAESIALALVGGAIGCLVALPIHGVSTGTTNWTSFSEVAFKFRITPALIGAGLVFAAAMGALGGLLPAVRAARIPIARALRET